MGSKSDDKRKEGARLFSKAQDYIRAGQFSKITGNADKAISLTAQAVTLAPDMSSYKIALTNLLRRANIKQASIPLRQALVICLQDDALFRQPLQHAWLSIIIHDADYRALTDITQYNSYDEFKGAIDMNQLRRVLLDDLLLSGLPVYFAGNPILERALTFVRRWFLEQHASPVSAGFTDFLAALGLHCFHNEYVFSQTTAEAQLHNELGRRLGAIPASEADVAAIAIYSCYAPLFELSNAERISRAVELSGHKLSKLLSQRQIVEPLAEKKIAGAIDAITPIRDSTSRAVKGHYEHNPYPRWLSLPRPKRNSTKRTDILRYALLDAGCGTGNSAISAAAALPDVNITAVDISRASLAYAKRKADEFDISNIQFAQADILELSNWGKRFDAVISGGVIHHLEDPSRGLRNLRDLLKPEGVLFVALYGEAARRDVVIAREWVKQHGLTANEHDIRKFREHVFACDGQNQLKQLERRNDFYSLSNCRDLVFHSMEHRFTCLTLKELLESLNLKFLGFHPLPDNIARGYARMFPADPEMVNLSNWQQFQDANPNAFNTMYNIWCCRESERPRNDLPNWLQGDADGQN